MELTGTYIARGSPSSCEASFERRAGGEWKGGASCRVACHALQLGYHFLCEAGWLVIMFDARSNQLIVTRVHVLALPQTLFVMIKVLRDGLRTPKRLAALVSSAETPSLRPDHPA